jgi:mycothiol synthase
MSSATNLRPYQGDADLTKILQAVGEWNAQTGGCGYLHPGDVCHHLSNGLRGQDPTPYLHLYEEDGRLIALVLLYPRHQGYEVLLDPRHRGSDLEAALLDWAERQMWARMQEAGGTGPSVGTSVMDCDTVRRDLLVARGYGPAGDPTFAYTTRSLTDPIPDSQLPEGFTIRATTGEQEAVALGEVHAGSFGSSWPGDAYRAVMQTPAYRFGRELVVVAPDGRLAAFLIYWCDPVSKSGLFEPVGCHADFQRRGLTKALMYEGMRQLQMEGMTAAVVLHLISSAPAAALYAAAGFRRKYTISDYRTRSSISQA